jgi:transposase
LRARFMAPSSPDLNPIENLWHILLHNTHKRKVQPRNEEALTVELQFGHGVGK